MIKEYVLRVRGKPTRIECGYEYAYGIEYGVNRFKAAEHPGGKKSSASYYKIYDAYRPDEP